MNNIYLLEQTLQREIVERRAAEAHREQIRALREALPVAQEPAVTTVTPPRVLLRVGRLVLTWLA